MAALDPSIQRAIRAWLEVDPDPATRAELEELLATEAHDELKDRFDSRLAFGTSGIRGPLGAGPNRMNRVTLRRMLAGLMRVLGPGARVVIGRDARTNSAAFASDAAMMVAAYGGHAVVIAGANPTPVLAYAVRAVKADAGLMVTASHNPPADNGCKVFWSDGVQLRSPNDQKIELEIEDVGLPSAEIVPRVEGGSIEDAPASLVADYLASIVPERSHAREDAESIRVVYTPLHGVGSELLLSAFARAGLAEPHVVPSQQQPDPAFPTVAFPNPEEPGALDLAFALANQVGGDLIVANDPDADRLSISIPDASAHHGWRTLTGDEVGALLVDRLIASNDVIDPLVVSTVVCSRLVERIAEAHGVAHESTLTGFKWIAGAAFRNPERFLFCYEESLGYAVTGAVRDKDGVSAAIEFVKLASDLRSAGSSVAQRLTELAAEHGLHTTKQVSVRFRGPGAVAKAGAAVDRLRVTATSELGGRSIEQRKDYQEGNGLPPTNLLRFELHGNVRVMLRPSGTEAKTKMYLEKVTPIADPSAVPATQASAIEELDQLASAIEAALLDL